jgi:hypothetical protein
MNDLWMFDISRLEWTWLSGNTSDNVGGTYNAKGVPSILYYPSTRQDHSMSLDPKENTIYIFGGNFQATTTGWFLHDEFVFDDSRRALERPLDVQY